MDKKKIIWTAIAVALTGAVASNFFHEHDQTKTWCQMLHSNGFAFGAGLTVCGVVYAYYLK